MPEKYIDRVVEIIYQAKDGQFTQRRICVQSINAGKVRAYDLAKNAPRVFDSDRILAVMPVMSRAAG
jgi:predicted DNA-binding transcriptional regulator YafY